MKSKKEMTVELQKYLIDLFYEWGMTNRIHNPTDSRFALEVLDTSISSYNQWVRGIRLPNVENAYKLYDRLEESFGTGKAFRLLEILEIKLRVPLTDPDMRTIYLRWGKLPETLKREMLRISNQNEQ